MDRKADPFKRIADLNKRRKVSCPVTVPGKTRRKPLLIEDVPLNGALINCRSVKPKLNFLAECFKINVLSLAILNETWLYRSDPQAKKLLLDLKNEHNIDIIRKDRDSRGGGVAVAFNSKVLSMRKLSLTTLNTKKHFKILATRGKLRGYKTEITVFSCYIPPKLTKNQSVEFLDLLTDAISEAKTTSEGWILIGGDWNNRSLQSLLDLYPDIEMLKTPPTRKDNTLDIVCSNFNNFIKSSEVCLPLEGELGQVSDHKIVIFEALLPRPKAFTWETHEYLQITKEGKKKFIETLNSTDWTTLKQAWPDQERMVEVFHVRLDEVIDACFSWKRVRRKSNDKPWITDEIRARIRRRKAVFRQEGRSELFKLLDKGIKKTIAFRKKKYEYEEKMTEKLEQAGRNNQWYNIYKFLASDEKPERWEITELSPDETPKNLANKLAVHFSKITNISRPLNLNDLPTSVTGNGMIPQLDKKNVEKALLSFKKCNSRVTGDIPKELVNPCASIISEALTLIYNACFLNKKWPSKWKTETIIPIPKTLSPGSFNDIRPISMTTLWSKILESYVATFTLQESGKNWKNSQFGGRKGTSTDHVLIKIWDDILTNLDNGSKAVVLSGIDFSKSFSKCSYQEILKAYVRLGLSNWCLQMHAAFLHERKMRV